MFSIPQVFNCLSTLKRVIKVQIGDNWITFSANKQGNTFWTVFHKIDKDFCSNSFRSLTPAKAYRLQNGKEADSSLKAKWEAEAKKKRDQEGKNDKGSNKMAERVLLRVSQKLNGKLFHIYIFWGFIKKFFNKIILGVSFLDYYLIRFWTWYFPKT